MSARSSRFSGFGSSRRRGRAAGAVIACAVLLAGCGGSAGSSAESGAPVIRGDAPVAADETAVGADAALGSLTAKAGVGVGEVVVSWSESQTSSTQKVTGYEVQVSTDSGGTWAGAGTGCAKDTTTKSTALTCTSTGLAAGTYSFRIATLKKNPNTKATKTTDFSPGTAGVTVIAAPGTPAKPTVVAGDAKVNVTVAAGTATDGTLGGAPTSYTVTAYTGTTATSMTCTVTGESGSCPVTGLTNGTPYTFTATATNARDTSGASGTSASVTPLGVPGAPTIGTVTASGSTSVTVAFTAPASNGGSAITTYTATSSPGAFTGTVSQAGDGKVTVTGLTAATSYTFTVMATNAKGPSLASGPSASVVTATAVSASVSKPGVPTFTVLNGSGKVTVAMTAGVGGTPTSYEAKAFRVASEGWLRCTDYVAPWSCDVTGLINDKTYSISVIAKNDAGSTSTDLGRGLPGNPSDNIVVPASGTYALGSVGPGGGKVFLVAKTPFACGAKKASTCSYLEMGTPAGTGWWCPSGDNISGSFGENVGDGYDNTTLMLDVCVDGGFSPSIGAATLASATRGGFSDWYLPSKWELMIALTYFPVSANPIGYWSSTPRWKYSNTGEPFDENFVSGSTGATIPIRAF